VAALALSAVLPQVDVVLLVAGQACRIQFHFVRRLLVATRANELRVSAGEREARLLAVVEFPQTPAVRRVAFGARNAQRAFVNVVLLMAVDALETGITILPGGVALLARHSYVQTQQGIFREIVIEAHPGPPTFGGVTLIASRAQFADVDIACAVASGAVRRQLLRGHAGRVARMTIDFYVTTSEFPVSVTVVVEVRRLPFLVTVTLAAVVAEAPGVRVLPLVAADAFAR